ncbi:MAG: BamA/TamA family outer membrane protein, partial [Pseudomonadota bacterium]
VTPKKRFGFKIGAGYGTDTGPRATLGVDARFLNPFGHFSTARWNASTRKRSLKAYYNMPGKQPADALYTLAIGHQFEHIDEQRARTDQLGISYLDRSGLWRRTIDVFYYTESYTEYAGDIAQRRRFLLPSVNYVRTKFDDPLNATEGFRIDVTMRGAAKLWLKHSANFLQMHTLMKYLYPLGVKTQIIARSELGVTFSRPSDLPLSLRFFAGGDQSVRGFAYQELGPREIDPYGQLSVIGGKHVFVGSLEAVHRIQGPFALSCFMDMGTAMNTLNTLESLPLSAGMGVHYKTPVGPLRIELAHPLISREFGSTWRIHINLGPELS